MLNACLGQCAGPAMRCGGGMVCRGAQPAVSRLVAVPELIQAFPAPGHLPWPCRDLVLAGTELCVAISKAGQLELMTRIYISKTFCFLPIVGNIFFFLAVSLSSSFW